ncbi:hypothetical protein RB653_000135 [Dictyostelium firmibasis]|uniref:W2 domain-containing protein n=1 Tax=Dictyostelium firmibasis TaxID=79012 RepID=A0AAN7U1U2_9MYCE
MAQVNIRRDVEDQFYRYKMEVLQGKVEGKGNGIKTVIVNLPNIARDLDRQPEYITKFFEIEFNAKSNIENEKYSINGQYTVERLASALDKFISKFILCSFCKNPETKFVIKKGVIEFKCAACGRVGPIDMKHKLSSYIVKNPPKAVSTKSTHDEALAQQPQIKKEKKSKKKKDDDEEDDDDVVWFTDTSEKAAEERKKKAIGDSTSAVISMMADISVETQGAKEKEQDDEEEDSEEKESDPVSSISSFLETNPTDQELMEKLDSVQEEFGLRSSATSKAAIEALGKNAENTVKFVKTQTTLLKKISKRRDGKLGILLGFEELCVKDETLLKSIQGILKNFFDAGILTEENILKWYHQKAKSKVVIKACKDFIEWLENAEEEDEDDEEEEEGEEEDS